MIRRPLRSSNLASVGYDRSLSILEIEFRNGHVYQYFVVPKEVYEALISAQSPGSYFVKYVSGRYRYRRVS